MRMNHPVWTGAVVCVFIVLLLPVTSGTGDVPLFVVSFTMQGNGSVEDVSVELGVGETHIPYKGSGDYRIALLNAEQYPLFKEQTHIQFVSGHPEPGTDVASMERDEVQFFARLPYASNVTYLELRKGEELVTTINLPEHVCDGTPYQAYVVYCEAQGVDPDAAGTTDGTQDSLPDVSQWMEYILGGFAALILAALGMLHYWTHGSHDDSPDNERTTNNRNTRRERNIGR